MIKKVAEKAHFRLPNSVDELSNSGFEELEAGHAVVITQWKRRNSTRLLASERIAVEHTLASGKRLRILRDEFRNRRKGMIDDVMAIGCSLHNFRWESRGRALGA